ncbi:dihydrodipicolinate reductase [Fervidobacterium changbaicum]|uniref:4-hydroxy-tetrahydrodipicolinate reductase n=2 Tax=Fervidobacterium TaxID=2422 RepID=A0AAI8GCC5_FERIS|nr:MULTISPECIES: dihydrodipicolinate reductase C-terminal domain-containing protein [Fervidobacterium]AMW32172.1 4-hydroxy-tetrahydrodipicolinate reductase [Fervidobacterium islandicum]QAV32495.1 4-hydroxy-tetrahydrodipicolinate reductase [Fervidobacterium changbaicum]SDH57718.1 dihydrodipicolinate reductase [Fervidobacterium changbaicum]
MSERNLRYGLIGANGKMGTEIQSYFSLFGDVCVFKKDKGFSEEIETPQVIIDFSSPDAVFETVELCKKYGSGLVIGTTALMQEHFDALHELANYVPVVQSYNFSTGIAILKRLLKEYGAYFEDWDAAMVEIHHNQKKDAPSGTAKILKQALGREVPISSIRVGGVFGEHTVIFSNSGETIELTHRALSRRAFAIGVRNAALFVLTKEKGFYSYDDVLASAGL